MKNAVEVSSKIEIGTPKTHKKRAVPFPAFLADALAEQMRGKHPDYLLFLGSDGRHMRRSGTSQTGTGWFVVRFAALGLNA